MMLTLFSVKIIYKDAPTKIVDKVHQILIANDETILISYGSEHIGLNPSQIHGLQLVITPDENYDSS